MREAVAAIQSASSQVTTAASSLIAVLGSGGGGRGGRRGGGAGSEVSVATLPSFESIRGSMNHLLEELDSADMAPTSSMNGAYAAACGDLRGGLSQWRQIQVKQLATLNAALTAAHAPALPVLPAIALSTCPSTLLPAARRPRARRE